MAQPTHMTNDGYRRDEYTLTWAALTGGYVTDDDTTVRDIRVDNKNYKRIVIYFNYTEAASATSFEAKIEFSPDATTWSQESREIATTGVYTSEPMEHTYASGTLVYNTLLESNDNYMRVSCKETGDTGGTITAKVIANY